MIIICNDNGMKPANDNDDDIDDNVNVAVLCRNDN